MSGPGAGRSAADRGPAGEPTGRFGEAARGFGGPAGGSRGAVFAALHGAGRPLVLPTAWDRASAAAYARAGFPAVGSTSLGVAAAGGYADATRAGRDATVALAVALAAGPVPVSADLEDGFADDPREVAALAADLAAAGVAGINVEDGRGPGRLAPAAHLAAVVAAVKAAAPGLFVNARTDAYWLHAAGRDEAVARIRAYAAAGADGVFVPGAPEPDLAVLTGAVDVPLNALAVPGGPTLARFAELGVRRVSCGSLPFRVALGAAVDAVTAIAAGAPVPGAGAPSYAEVDSWSRP
jgi:2-methylisocitrate lyase-like PEP mutase family enzyme